MDLQRGPNGTPVTNYRTALHSLLLVTRGPLNRPYWPMGQGKSKLKFPDEEDYAEPFCKPVTLSK